MQSSSLNSKSAPTACGSKKYRQERYRTKSLPLAYILPYKRTHVRSHQLLIYRTPALAAVRANRLADSSSPTARASQALGHLCPRVLLRGNRSVSGSVPRRRARGQAAPVEPEGVRAAERGARDCGGGEGGQTSHRQFRDGKGRELDSRPLPSTAL